MVKVLVDTNALLAIFQFKLNLEKELDRLLGKYEILVPTCVIQELKKLRAKHAKSALKLAERYIKTELNGKVDNAILELAKEGNIVVATNDRALRKKLRANKIPVVFLRARKKLELDGIITTQTKNNISAS
ncbi:MAG: twitching motility protein PilT [Candidatus Thermoplasmatota archaeon]|nr:twitching motility protein PilT [Candidatus Thermoplasmatota archaeon]MDI6856395.1 twitching motility protein PilT [Candidatus Thermoplasmatota archaeon]MDI6887055.1 twitching motility protein PilT [Candidatus Thermoplasmatota archaeon]